MLRKTTILGLMLFLVGSIAGTILAQGNAQFCIRSYEDRNGNGLFDAGEPPITRGLSANILDESGVIVGTTTLEDSDFASQGIFCFLGLNAGTYQVQVSGADYTAISSNAFLAQLSDNQIERVDFGGQRLDLQIPVVEEDTSDNELIIGDYVLDRFELERFLYGLVGSFFVISAMIFLGTIAYFGIFRPRLKKFEREHYMRYGTGQMQAVRSTGTGGFPAVPSDTGAYAPPPQARVESPPQARVDPTPSQVPIVPITEEELEFGNEEARSIFAPPDTDASGAMPPVVIDEPPFNDEDTGQVL